MPPFFEPFLHSTTLVALSEIGDKTQLLALILAARYQKPAPIIFGIFVATLINHAFAAWVGTFVGGLGIEAYMPWLVAIAFIGLGLWILVPDKIEEGEGEIKKDYGPFVTTTIMFFLAEMGDKTQIATVALGAQYDNLIAVVFGTTLGMMLANVPAVFFGDKVLKVVPMQYIRWAASVMFVGFGVWQVVELLR
ncbi:TMEM165/GDT1 family protein [Asticcacaulis endophyticus]|uniref:GDT1 family protein n=1 Tax=Asticcacaulis endophyticus TaxID=1395890 RepID=A0A918Q060_9CAUL|nr:TMEM165/GDT1 family protein [Asticcacaulis endophyticus]GGZ28855.1 UPF0016 family membrane protein [Asticcacaulis endophyticus]